MIGSTPAYIDAYELAQSLFVAALANDLLVRPRVADLANAASNDDFARVRLLGEDCLRATHLCSALARGVPLPTEVLQIDALLALDDMPGPLDDAVLLRTEHPGRVLGIVRQHAAAVATSVDSLLPGGQANTAAIAAIEKLRFRLGIEPLSWDMWVG